MKDINVEKLIDDAAWSGRQKLLIFATALTIILDGMDFQLLGNAIPILMREWSLPRPAFATVLALGPLGMVIGSLLGGILGDRLGRRRALLISVVAFAVVTLGIAGANGLAVLGLLRFLSGLGLGGAMPNAAALVSEFAPRRSRPFAVTATIVCFPLGGTVAALLSAQVLPAFGWRILFVLGGVIPIAIAVMLFKVLPESPRYMAARRERWPELVALLRRMGNNVAPNSTFAEPGALKQPKASSAIREMFSSNLRQDTLGLFGAFFFCLMANNVGFSWIVAMLTGAGFAQAGASNALAAFNFGGVAGAILAALVIQRLGSRITMLTLSAAAVLSALFMATLQLDPTQSSQLIAMFALTGGLLNAVQTTMYALATNVFPTSIRSTGVGTVVAFGRCGIVLAPYVGSFALDRGGPPAYFSTWAITMVLVLISLAIVRRHIDRQPGQRLGQHASATH